MIRVLVRVRIWDRVRVTVRVIVTVMLNAHLPTGSRQLALSPTAD